MLGVFPDGDEIGIAQHPEMAGHARLTNTQCRHELPHRPLPIAQEIENLPAGWFGDDLERRTHTTNITDRIYKCQEMFARRRAEANRPLWFMVRLFTLCIVGGVSTSTTLLALLEQEPAYGYSLKQRYDDQFGHARPIAFGQVYAALSRFDRRGYAAVDGVDADGGPTRTRYRITSEGAAVVERWVTSPEPATSYASSTLFAKVSIALTSDRSAQSVLAAQREEHLGRMRELTRRRRGADVSELLAIIFELNHLDADLRWIEEAGHRLAELRREIDHG